MTFKFSQRSLDNLKGVHPHLIKVMTKAIETAPYDFGITEGVRSKERQKELVAQGKSMLTESRHLTGHAVDVAIYVDGKITWEFEKYKELADHIKAITWRHYHYPIAWGGDWKTFKDGVHFELPRRYYK